MRISHHVNAAAPFHVHKTKILRVKNDATFFTGDCARPCRFGRGYFFAGIFVVFIEPLNVKKFRNDGVVTLLEVSLFINKIK